MMERRINIKEELIGCYVELFFDEWTKHWVEIELIDPLFNFEIIEPRKGRKYYVFKGIILSENPFRLEKGTKCKFHFSKKLFLKELKRFNMLISQMELNDCLKFSMRRINKHKIEIKNLERLAPN